MYTTKSLTLAVATCISMAAAQNSTSIYNNTKITVRSPTQYSEHSLIGYHVGAALNYIVARASDSGDLFSYNTSATSAQLLDNTIVPGYQMPCYIVNTPEISNVSGPLECGAGDQIGYYDVARVTPSDGANSGTLAFDGINEWFICAVQSFTYGWVQGTVVGLFGSGVPLGPGVTNCTAIEALVLTATSGVSNGSVATTTGTMTSSSTATATTTLSNFSGTSTRSTVYPLSTPQSTTSVSASSTSSSTSASNSTTSSALPSQTTGLTHISATNNVFTTPPAVPVTPPYSATSHNTATVSSTDKTSTTQSGSSADSSVSPAISNTSTSTTSISSSSTTFSSTSGGSTNSTQPLSTSNGSSMTTITVPSSTTLTTSSTTFSTGSNPIYPISSYTGSYAPIATYVGAASAVEVSLPLGLTIAIAMLLL